MTPTVAFLLGAICVTPFAALLIWLEVRDRRSLKKRLVRSSAALIYMEKRVGDLTLEADAARTKRVLADERADAAEKRLAVVESDFDRACSINMGSLVGLSSSQIESTLRRKAVG